MYNGQQVLGAGELVLPGEIRLAAGESYQSPWLHAAFGDGLNEVSRRFHRYLRVPAHAPASPRPVVVNTWEAVYFDHDLDRLTELAEAAAAAGAERFVLDDGWFLGRRNDHAGLGDWFVDPTVWPDGLAPLIERVHRLGMQFGLWVEPEMINLESELARAHPEWIFRAGGREGIATRQQYVLDLGHPDAYAYIAGCLHALLDEYDIACLKWDHNRMVVEAGHSPSGAPGVHRHTLAVYRLMDELRQRHPGLEIESCAGGGGRIDLEILNRTDRVWPSDCIDALERQQIQRYTMLLLPPELVGTHLGDAEAHTTQRRHHVGFRAAAALWGHMGIEWDLTSATPGKRALVRRWVELHKQFASAAALRRRRGRRPPRSRRVGERRCRAGQVGCGLRHHHGRPIGHLPARAGPTAGARSHDPVPGHAAGTGGPLPAHRSLPGLVGPRGAPSGASTG